MMVILGIYLVLLLTIGVIDFRTNKTFDDYVLAGRKTGMLFIGVSLMASTIGGASTVGLIKKVYSVGFPAIWFLAVGGFAHFFQAWLLSSKVRKSEARTLPDLGEKLMGPAVRRLISLIIVITWTGIISAQFIAAAGIIKGLIGSSASYIIFVSAIVITLYSLLGGQASILKTDFLQFAILVGAVVIGVIFLYTSEPVSSIPFALVNDSFTPLDLVYYVTVVSGSYFICPMMFGRLLSAKDRKSAVKSSLFSGTGILVFAFLITLMGVWAKQNHPAFEGDLFTGLILSYVQKGLGVILVLGVLSAIISTADTALITTASIIEHDLIGKSRIGATRIILVVVALVSLFIGTKTSDIIGTLLKAFAIYTSGIVPTLFVSIFFMDKKKMNRSLSFIAILTGGILGITATLTGMRFIALGGIALSFIIALAASYTGKKD
jgi:SSS family solute:Na+ symporter